MKLLLIVKNLEYKSQICDKLSVILGKSLILLWTFLKMKSVRCQPLCNIHHNQPYMQFKPLLVLTRHAIQDKSLFWLKNLVMKTMENWEMSNVSNNLNQRSPFYFLFASLLFIDGVLRLKKYTICKYFLFIDGLSPLTICENCTMSSFSPYTFILIFRDLIFKSFLQTNNLFHFKCIWWNTNSE